MSFLLPKIVGILNLTPDSFSGDGALSITNDQLRITNVIEEMIRNGADIIDIGAESTAPGAADVTVAEELERLTEVFGVITNYELRITKEAKFSIDTRNAKTAQKAIKSGFTIVNDVSGGRYDSDMLPLIAEAGVKYVMMYCKNSSGRADTLDNQHDVYAKILQFFDDQIQKALSFGIKREQLILDPGMGAFISTHAEDSLEVLHKIPELKKRYLLPIFIGTSRKGFLAKLTSHDFGPNSRLGSSLATALFAAQQGADYLRVHDVLETRQMLEVFEKFKNV